MICGYQMMKTLVSMWTSVMNSKELKVFIEAKVSTTLEASNIEHMLVASLFNIDSNKKISDGYNASFHILDYFSTKAIDPELVCDDSIKFIEEKLETELLEIFSSNSLNTKYLNQNIFERAVSSDEFYISEYQLGRIYAYSEMYFQLTGKANPYATMIENIVSYDIEKYNLEKR